jgi:hypothetical protein
MRSAKIGKGMYSAARPERRSSSTIRIAPSAFRVCTKIAERRRQAPETVRGEEKSSIEHQEHEQPPERVQPEVRQTQYCSKSPAQQRALFSRL